MKTVFKPLVSRLVEMYRGYGEDRSELRSSVSQIEERMREGGLEGISFTCVVVTDRNIDHWEHVSYQVGWLKNSENGYKHHHLFIRRLARGGPSEWFEVAEMKGMSKKDIEMVIERFLIRFTECLKDQKNKMR
jgi:hypothetical protein